MSKRPGFRVPAMAEVAVSRSWAQGMSSDNIKGLVLALSSSFFIGASFIVKKKGLKKAGASGVRAGNSIFGFFSNLCHGFWGVFGMNVEWLSLELVVCRTDIEFCNCGIF